MTATRSNRRRPKPVRGLRRIAMIALSAGLGLLAGALVLEIGLRVRIAFLFRETIDSIGGPAPHDPNKLVAFRELLQPDPDPKLVYRMKPGLSGRFLKLPLNLNAHGFRGEDISDSKTSRTVRIACLGDSTLFGWAVKPEERYSDLLRDRLQAAFGPDWRIETANLGVPSYNSIQEVETFDVEKARIKPDAVLIQFDPNDTGIASFLRKHSFFRLDRLYLTRIVDLFDGELVDHEFWDAEGPPIRPEYAKLDGGWAMLEAYRRLIGECRDAHLPLVVALSYWDVQDANGAKRDASQNPLRDLCESMHVPIADPYPVVKAAMARDGMKYSDFIRDYPHDLHPTVNGHILMADAIFPDLFRGLAAGRLDDAASSAALAEESIAAEQRHFDFGFYDKENWDGISVQWTKQKAQRLFERTGNTMTVKYLTADPGITAEHPLQVEFQIEGLAPKIIKLDKPGFYEEHFDLQGLEARKMQLGISVSRTYSENGKTGPGRDLGIALYPLEFGTDSKPG